MTTLLVILSSLTLLLQATAVNFLRKQTRFMSRADERATIAAIEARVDQDLALRRNR